jgi:hypothetical protein
MNIGADFFGTLTGDRNRGLLYGILQRLQPDCKVHVISHVRVGNKDQTRGIIESQGFRFDSINVVESDDYAEAPQLKLEVCQRLGIELFIDDRLDTCELLSKYGILTMHIV